METHVFHAPLYSNHVKKNPSIFGPLVLILNNEHPIQIKSNTHIIIVIVYIRKFARFVDAGLFFFSYANRFIKTILRFFATLRISSTCLSSAVIASRYNSLRFRYNDNLLSVAYLFISVISRCRSKGHDNSLSHPWSLFRRSRFSRWSIERDLPSFL